ncbi:MAG: beta-glucosidase [Candidatus Hodarchaeales archaeon]|jgi:beta-glucosidase
MNQKDLLFRNTGLDIEVRVDDLLNHLRTDEKFKLLAGTRYFQTHSIKRLGVKPFKMTDGPLGVSMHSSFFRKNTKFPGGICMAATWNRDLAKNFGIAVGEEARAIGRHALLAPGINVDRSPLNGRTFEYFSEDPFLIKEMTIPYVKGIQNEQRIAACIKHYVANNQETNRFTVSAEIDERTLHEVYLRAFMDVIREADPWMIMTSYNKVNGHYLFANKELLKDLTWKKWNFNGFIVSDWWAFARADPPVLTVECIKAGMSLEMPKANIFHPDSLKSAFSEGKITEEDLNAVLKRLLRTMFLVGLFDNNTLLPKGKRNTPDHQELARKIAEDGMVLLKNKNNILPLDINRITKLAVLGPNRDKKFGKWLYGGSSAVKPPYEITPLKGLKQKCKGKCKIITEPNEADFVIIFSGLNHDSEGKLVTGNKKSEILPIGHDAEGTDRVQLELPDDQVYLINKTVQQNPKTIVVLLNGSPIAMDGWLENIPAVLEAWYPGMESGRAISNVLFGDVNPSGKLPITFPKELTDSPAHRSTRTFPGEDLKVFYDEGVMVGYRYFDKEKIEPLFPFGFGLSYTTFLYENLKVEKKKLSERDNTTVTVDVINTGSIVGAEVVQLYIQDVESSVERPPKELRGFEKVILNPQERKKVTLSLRSNDFAFYDVSIHDWKIESGEFNILIGSSSRNIHLQEKIEI